MHQKAKFDAISYSVTAYTMNNTRLLSGSVLNVGESITVQLSPPPTNEMAYLMEATTGEFKDDASLSYGAKCHYTRTFKDRDMSSIHKLSLTQPGNCSIYFGWANAYGLVHISNAFFLDVRSNESNGSDILSSQNTLVNDNTSNNFVAMFMFGAIFAGLVLIGLLVCLCLVIRPPSTYSPVSHVVETTGECDSPQMNYEMRPKS